MMSAAPTKWTILVIGNDSLNLSMLPNLLPFYGAKAYGASSGKQALELLRTLKPTVILLGLGLKDMDCTDFLWQMRAIPGQANTCVIGMWTRYSFSERKRVLDAGCVDYLCQAVTLNMLLIEIENCLLKAEGGGPKASVEQLPVLGRAYSCKQACLYKGLI